MGQIPRALKCYEVMKVFLLSSGNLVFDDAVAAPLSDLLDLYCPRPASLPNAVSVRSPPPKKKACGVRFSSDARSFLYYTLCRTAC